MRTAGQTFLLLELVASVRLLRLYCLCPVGYTVLPTDGSLEEPDTQIECVFKPCFEQRGGKATSDVHEQNSPHLNTFLAAPWTSLVENCLVVAPQRMAPQNLTIQIKREIRVGTRAQRFITRGSGDRRPPMDQMTSPPWMSRGVLTHELIRCPMHDIAQRTIT